MTTTKKGNINRFIPPLPDTAQSEADSYEGDSSEGDSEVLDEDLILTSILEEVEEEGSGTASDREVIEEEEEDVGIIVVDSN